MEIKAIIKANVIPGPKRISDTRPDIFFMLIDQDPRVEGCQAPLGSIASVPSLDGNIPYYKWGTEPNQWSPIINRRRQIEFIGRGTGPTKTVTVIDGPVIAEEMQIDDELFLRWAIPDNMIPREDLNIIVHFYINTSELGKLVSFELDIGSSDGIAINTVLGVESDYDILVSDQYIDAHAIFTLTHAEYSKEDIDGLNMKLTRVASSDDPTAHPRVHLINAIF